MRDSFPSHFAKKICSSPDRGTHRARNPFVVKGSGDVIRLPIEDAGDPDQAQGSHGQIGEQTGREDTIDADVFHQNVDDDGVFRKDSCQNRCQKIRVSFAIAEWWSLYYKR